MVVQPIQIEESVVRKKGRSRRIWLWILGGAALFIFAGVALVFANSGLYGRIQEYRLLKKAHRLVQAKDYGNAALFTRRVLQYRPQSIEANRLMAELCDNFGAIPQELAWRRRVADLLPNSLQDRLAWADAALRLSEPEPELATQALAGMETAGKNVAAYHEMQGRIADALNDPSKAETDYGEALALDPQNHQYAMELAGQRVRSGDKGQKTGARKQLQTLSEDPSLHVAATRVLIDDAVTSREGDTAITLSKGLQAAPQASFQDKLRYLGVLSAFHRPEFPAALADLENSSVSDPLSVARVMQWMDVNEMALLAVDWSRRLPKDIATKNPVPPAIAISHALLGDWPDLKTLVSGGNWAQAEFMRYALLARVSFHNGDTLTGQNQWSAAVRMASTSEDNSTILARLAVEWDMVDLAEDLLWRVAQRSGRPSIQLWALRVLYNHYWGMHIGLASAGNNADPKRDTSRELDSTRDLLKVSARMYELDPTDPLNANNLAAYELLLQSNVQQAVHLSRDLYQSDPANPTYATTYAFALHLLGRSTEGVQILKKLGEHQLSDPANAIYYGTLLAATGADPAQARKYLDIAESGALFPEERTLLSQARDQLGYHTSEKPAPAGK